MQNLGFNVMEFTRSLEKFRIFFIDNSGLVIHGKGIFLKTIKDLFRGGKMKV